MSNEFKVKNGLIVIGELTTSGTITINGALAATQSWVTSQAYLTSASLSGYATQSYVTSAIASLVDSAPGALDTLRELATALGNDASFSTTVTNSIAAKLPLAGGTMSGSITFSSAYNAYIYTFSRVGLANQGRIIYNNGTGSNMFFGELASNVYGFTPNAYTDTPALSFNFSTNNVGIGTSSPLFNLQVGSNAGTIATTTIRLQNSYLDTNGYYGFNIDAVDNGVSGHDLRFLGRSSPTGAFSELVRIKNTGNVGIGTSSPSSLLNIVASGSGPTALTVQDNARKVKIGRDQIEVTDLSDVASTMYLQPNSNVVINGTAGNVGIGSQPSYKLDVNGTIRTQTGYILGANGSADITIDGNIGSQLRYGNQKILFNSADAYIYTNNIARLSITNAGIATFSNNLITTNGIADPGYVRITNPEGGISVGNSPTSAAIKIALPANGSFTNIMLSFTVHIYDYALGKTRTLKIAGYTYYNQDWYNMSVYQSGGELIGNINVRFGVEGGRNCVWIGETNTYWSYPNIFITDVQCGHSQTANLTSGWTISLVTTLGTVQNTIVAYTNITTKDIGGTTNYVSKFTGANTLGNSLIFDNGTNVGIGVSSPGYKLEVEGSIGVKRIGVAATSTLDMEGNFNFNANSGYSHVFKQAGSEVVRILPSGNVGIGTVSPTGKLDIVPSAQNAINISRAGGYASLYSSNDFVFETDSIFYFGVYTPRLFSVNGSFYTTAAGSVGIGTSSPSTKLEVRGNMLLKGDATDGGILTITRRYSTGAQTINFNNNHPGSNLDWTGARITSADAGNYNGYLDFAVSLGGNGSEAAGTAAVGSVMRLTKDGYVGIGTTAPATSLEVQGAANTSIQAIFQSSSSGNAAYNGGIQLGNAGSNQKSSIVHTSAGDNTLTFTSHYSSGSANKFIFAPGGTETVRFQQNGNVGIGTTDPTSQMSGTFGIGIYNALYPAVGFKNSTTAWLWYGQDSTFRMWNATFGDILTANTSGNIGIGTSSPGAKLHVVGKSIFENNMRIYPASESWAEGLSFIMPTTANWGGLRWQRQRGNSDGNWYVGFTALDSTDDLVFGANNGGSQVDNIIRLTKAGNVGVGTGSPNAKLDVAGNTRFGSGSFNVSTDQSFGSVGQYNFRDAVAIWNPNSASAPSTTAVMSIGSMTNGVSLVTTGQINASGGNSSNWNTAYGWGNHASVGYITSAGSISGNAATSTTSTTFASNRNTYKGVTDNAVAGQLMWKNYGNQHTIFDASQGTSPDGGSVSNTNSNAAWSATYPTLMGWNGSQTYGVRVDSARIADTATVASALTSMNISQFTNNSNYVAYGNYSWTSPVFGQYGIKSNLIDNVLYSAADRFELFKAGVAWNSNGLFNLNYDSNADTIPVNTSRTYSIVLNTKGNSASGITYTQGNVYLSFYYTFIPASVSGRVRLQNGTWVAMSDWTNVANSGSYAVWRGNVPTLNYMVEIEITINANSSTDTWFAQWEYVMGRPGQYELGIFNKAQDNSIWRSLYFLDSSNVARVTINSGGISANTVTSNNFTVSNAIYFGAGNNYLNWTNGRIYSNVGIETASNLVVGGNSYLGNASGDETHINDILRVGATDSGDAHFYFGEGSLAGSDYGSHWHWDSGYRFTWNTRNNGTDTVLFYYDTNSLSYITWNRSHNINANSIDYVGQLHFNGGTRFNSYNTNYLYFQTDSTNNGGIIVRDGNASTRGYSGYFDSDGFGLLNSSGSWGIRLNPGNVGIELFYAGNWRIRTRSDGAGVNGNLYTDQNYGYGLVGVYSSTRYQGVFAMSDSYKLSADGTSTGNLYGIAWTHTNVGGQSKSGLGHQALFMDNGTTQTAIGSGIWTNGLITTTSYGTSANWNTAYGWGNHAGLYLGINSKAVDSELLDGIDSSGFVKQLADTNTPDYQNPSSRRVDPNALNPTNEHYAVTTFGNGSNVTGQLATHFQTGNLYSRGYNSTWSAWRRYWNDIDFTSTNVSNWNTAYSWGNHASYSYATTSYVTTQINNLINGAPGVLDTLDELAAALGDDSNFATTVTNSIATKLPLAGGTMSGNLQVNAKVGTLDNQGIYLRGIGDATHKIYYRTSDGGNVWEYNSPIKFEYYNSGIPLTRLTLDIAGNLTIGGFLTESSSLKLKENVKTSEGNLEKVVNLRPVTYNKIGSQTKELGLIAEEVATVYPEFVQYDESGEPVGVNYSRLTAALIGAVKELTQRIETLENNG